MNAINKVAEAASVRLKALEVENARLREIAEDWETEAADMAGKLVTVTAERNQLTAALDRARDLTTMLADAGIPSEQDAEIDRLRADVVQGSRLVEAVYKPDEWSGFCGWCEKAMDAHDPDCLLAPLYAWMLRGDR